MEHNSELAHKAQRRLEGLAAESRQLGSAQLSCQPILASQQALQYLTGPTSAPAPAPAKPAAAVLLADFVAGADDPGVLEDTAVQVSMSFQPCQLFSLFTKLLEPMCKSSAAGVWDSEVHQVCRHMGIPADA